MIIYRLFNLFLNFIYLFFKLIPTNKKKIFFLSRQSKELSLDYKLLIEEIKTKYPDYKIKTMNNMLGKTLKDRFKYIKIMLVQMYHLATSKTCVIDGYNITVSVLKHKKKLRVIQIWHSLIALKKFGYQTLDREDGNSSKTAKVMKMHKNYDYIVTGSKKMIPYFSEAFNNDESKFINCGLPRIDYILNKSEENKNKILEKYPELKNKKIILYVPTFRKFSKYHIEALIKAVNNTEYELIIKGHPLKKIKNQKYSENFASIELLSIADYIITDYSGMAIEATILNKPLYFYVYDIDEYKEKIGLNIDLEKEYKKITYRDANEIIKNIEENKYSYKDMKKFKKNYIDNVKGNATETLVKYIVGEL